MDCKGCERGVRRTLKKMKGIHEVIIEREMQKVVVKGSVEPFEVLKKLRATQSSARFLTPSDDEETPTSDLSDSSHQTRDQKETMSQSVAPPLMYQYDCAFGPSLMHGPQLLEGGGCLLHQLTLPPCVGCQHTLSHSCCSWVPRCHSYMDDLLSLDDPLLTFFNLENANHCVLM
ncbi:hypothetical protein KP509_24G019500 [Ceratopteris richardii]|nr:hypothetical protein KP509_24G019500 [Ceratopteris richardii]